MRVAVVTPFYKTPPDWLAQCHDSVRAQTHPCTHILVSDGCGEPPLNDFAGQVIQLGQNHADNGNTPRCAGSVAAAGEGFDAIAYLDADNWFAPTHIESMVRIQRETGALVCTSGRELHAMDGAYLGPCNEVDGVHFADTSCLFLTRPAFPTVMQWVLMPRDYSVICDFWYWSNVRRRKLRTAYSGQRTMAFRTSYPHHYARFGRPLPDGAKSAEYSRQCANKILSLRQVFGEAAAVLPHWATAGVKL